MHDGPYSTSSTYGSEGHYGSYNDGYGHHMGSGSVPPSDKLASLISLLNEYDSLRVRLEQQGGRQSDVVKLGKLLKKEICLESGWSAYKVSLNEPARLRSEISYCAGWDVHLEIRRTAAGLPLYFLPRVKGNFSGGYAFVLEEIYKSPGFPEGLDGRLIKLMGSRGHQICHIRLSAYRESLRRTLGQDSSDYNLDGKLLHVGQEVLQTAFHEDQILAVLLAEQLYQPILIEAVEVLYLVLGADLCQLRAATDQDLTNFFRTVYPQNAIARFLEQIHHMSGAQLDSLPRVAMSIYGRLILAFRRFLRDSELVWGPQKLELPLYKILLANVSRPETFGPLLRADKNLLRRVQTLADEAEALTNALLTGP